MFINITKKQKMTYLLAFLSILLLIFVFRKIDYLTVNKYIIECFSNLGPIKEDVKGGSTTHTVNMPINTSYQCRNFCGPTSRCAITGHQCFTDVDCPGCQPKEIVNEEERESISKCVPGYDDAGKLTSGATPNFSSLTTDKVSQNAKPFNADEKFKIDKPIQPYWGLNIWRKQFDEERKLFNKRYKPVGFPHMMSYPLRYTMTGQFQNSEPLPSNTSFV